MTSLANHSKHMKKDKYQLFTKSSENKEERTLSNSFYEAKTILRIYKKRQLQTDMSCKYRCKTTSVKG